MALVLELLPNGSMKDALENHELKMTWTDPLWRLALDASKGMQYLHNMKYYDDITSKWCEKVVHRDLKTSNMLLTPTYGLKLIDFGEARAVDIDVTMTQGVRILCIHFVRIFIYIHIHR